MICAVIENFVLSGGADVVHLRPKNSIERESEMKSKCSIKRKLPNVNPQTTTKGIRNDRIIGYGARTYEQPVPKSQIELRIPPQKSNSQAAERERELKSILDLARQDMTATEIVKKTGCSRNRVLQVVRQFAEYGAKLKPEPKKTVANPDPGAGKYRAKWTPEENDILMEMRKAGCTWSEIGEKLGRTCNACSMQWGRESERRINLGSVFRNVADSRQSD